MKHVVIAGLFAIAASLVCAQGAGQTADLKNLPPGQHGFHIHQNGKCELAR